jgi:hypothetical protein
MCIRFLHSQKFRVRWLRGLLDVLFSNQLISVPCSQLIVCWELDFIRVLWKLPRTTKFLLFGTWAHFAKFRKNSLNLCFIYCRFISSIQNMGAGSIFTVINQYWLWKFIVIVMSSCKIWCACVSFCMFNIVIPGNCRILRIHYFLLYLS